MISGKTLYGDSMSNDLRTDNLWRESYTGVVMKGCGFVTRPLKVPSSSLDYNINLI